jgi:hypothetical protein
MKSYIKLLSAALLIAGATTQVSAMEAEFAKLRVAGVSSSTLHGNHINAAKKNMGFDTFGLPETAEIRGLQSKFRAWEEANPIAPAPAPTSLTLGGYSEAITADMKAHGHTDAAITLLGALDNTAAFTKARSTAIDFSDAMNANQTVADYTASVSALAAVPAVTSLKKSNQLYLVKAISELLGQKDDVTTAISEVVQAKALTKFTTKPAIITEADSKSAVGKVLAGLVKDIYDAEVTHLPMTNANLDKDALVTTELEKDATWTAILAALK